MGKENMAYIPYLEYSLAIKNEILSFVAKRNGAREIM
jgi:hypothetical protein